MGPTPWTSMGTGGLQREAELTCSWPIQEGARASDLYMEVDHGQEVGRTRRNKKGRNLRRVTQQSKLQRWTR